MSNVCKEMSKDAYHLPKATPLQYMTCIEPKTRAYKKHFARRKNK